MHALRSALTAGMAAVTATAVVAAPAINPTPAPAQPVTVSIPVHNTAASSPYTLFDLVANPPQLPPAGVVAPPNAPTTVPAAAITSAAVTTAATGGMGNHPSTGLIMNVYNAVEPWVAWGVNLAAWGIGWVPWIGLLAIPIRVVYYTGEPIVRSLFQVAQDIVKLNFSNIPSALIDGVVQAANGFISQFLPPLPPIGRANLAPTAAGLNSDLAAATTALASRTLTLPNGSNLADFGKKITEGIHDLVDRSALKNLTSGNPLSLTGTPEKVAKDGIKPTVAIEAAEIEEADATTPPPVVAKKFDRGSLPSLRDLKLPTLRGNAAQPGASKKAAEKPAEKNDADSEVAGITLAGGVANVQSDASTGAGTNGFAGKPNGIFSGKPNGIVDKQARNATGTPSAPDANQTGPKGPKRTDARTGKDSNNDSPAPKRIRSHSRGH